MRETVLVIHFVGLAMALGTGFANLFLGIVASKLEPAENDLISYCLAGKKISKKVGIIKIIL